MSVPGMGPMIPSDFGIEKSDLPDLVQEFERKAAALSGALNPVIIEVLEAHMRVINSYYSNLIEGHSSHPKDIRRAMEGDYDDDPAKRDLQLESRAHIITQQQFAQKDLTPAYLTGRECLVELHETFYNQLPDSLRIAKGGGVELEVVPGHIREGDEDVVVGRHVAPEAEHLDKLLNTYSEAYSFEKVRGQKRIIAVMAAHHRLTWIHPFMDGNGRVGRLLTDMLLKAAGIGGCGVWCLSRGLARNNEAYKAVLARADHKRQGDRDGRGQLSEARLIEFCSFMIRTAIDQIEYMTSVLDLGDMSQRIYSYIRARNDGLVSGAGPIKIEAFKLIERAYFLGEFERKDMEMISGLEKQTARRLVRQLKEEGLLTETSSRSPLRWAIPEHAERYFLPDLAPTG